MAIHTELSIYKVAYELLCNATEYVREMPRNVKPVVGNEVHRLCLEISTLIYEANCALDKVPHLNNLLKTKARLETLLRSCQDHRFITKRQYAKAIAHTISIGKQATGWRNSCAPAA